MDNSIARKEFLDNGKLESFDIVPLIHNEMKKTHVMNSNSKDNGDLLKIFNSFLSCFLNSNNECKKYYIK